MPSQDRPTTTSTNYDKQYDEDPTKPGGQKVKAGEYDLSRKNRSPDDRSTEPDPSATNHDGPLSAGSGIAGAPGVGTIESSDIETATPATDTVAHSTPQVHTRSGVNRVEDQSSKASPRLSIPSDEAGPGPSAQTPELQDPNYTAETDRSGS